MRYPNDTLKARFWRVIYPSYSTCFRCGMPWKKVTEHTVYYTQTSGIFALCEDCWSKTSLRETVNFYSLLVFDGKHEEAFHYWIQIYDKIVADKT